MAPGAMRMSSFSSSSNPTLFSLLVILLTGPAPDAPDHAASFPVAVILGNHDRGRDRSGGILEQQIALLGDLHCAGGPSIGRSFR